MSDGSKKERILDKWLPEGVVSDAVRSALYSGIESPANSVGQLWNKTAGRQLGKVESLGLVSAPTEATFGSFRWHAQTIGGAAGMVAPFLLSRVMVKGASCTGASLTARVFGQARTFELAASSGLRLATPVLEAGATGAVFEGLFRPVEPKDGSFWAARARNSAVGFATFSVMAGTNQGLKALDRAAYASSPWMINTYRSDLRRQVVSGGIAGFSDAQFRSLASGKGLASGDEVLHSTYSFALLGGMTRTAGELGARARGRLSVSDVVARDASLQEVVKQSDQSKMLLSDFGDVRVNAAEFKGGPENGLARTSGLVEAMSAQEAKAAIAPAESWDVVAKRKMSEAKASEAARAAELEAHLSKVQAEAKERGLPDQNWEQNRHALIRERAFLNDIQNKLGEAAEYKVSIEALERAWYRKWSQTVEPGQELQARLSQSFNANHAEPASAEKYNQSMRDTGPAKAAVVEPHLPADKHATLVDIGSADGFVPDALTRSNPKVTAFALELDPHSFLGMLAKSRADRAGLAGGQQPEAPFKPLPIFADGVMPKLPVKAVDAFTSLSNVHELISYPKQYYGPFELGNARLAIWQWARSLKDGGKIVVKDFMLPEVKGTDTVVLKFKDLTGTRPQSCFEGEPVAAEYLDGRAGKLWFEEFVGQRPWRVTENGAAKNGQPEFATVSFQGKNLRYRWLQDGSGIECDLATAGEIMVSSRYGMLETRNEMKGVMAEQFMNLTRDGYSSFFRAASPLGYRLKRIGEPSSKAGADYLQHRQQYFELFAKDPATGNLSPVDLSAGNKGMHVTYQGAFAKVPAGAIKHLLDIGTGPLERSLQFQPLLRFSSHEQKFGSSQIATGFSSVPSVNSFLTEYCWRFFSGAKK
jgi:hypothetical protein